MNDHPEDSTTETAMQRALRIRKTALENRPKAPNAGKFRRRPPAGVAPGASKPWMKK